MKTPWALVCINWRDAFDNREGGWTDIEGYEPEPTTVWTVGWIWPDCLTGYVTLVGSYVVAAEMQTVGAITHIPSQMVISTTILNQPQIPQQASQPITGAFSPHQTCA